MFREGFPILSGVCKTRQTRIAARIRREQFLLGVIEPIDHGAECDVWLYRLNSDLDGFALIGFGDDHHVATFDTGDPVALVADILDLDDAGFALADRRLRLGRRGILTLWCRFGGRRWLGWLGRAVGLRQHGNPEGFTWGDRTLFDLPGRHAEAVALLGFGQLCGVQTGELLG